MTTPHKAMLIQARDALQAALSDDQPYIERSVAAVAALQAAIDAPEPEPIGYAYEHQDFIGSVIGAKGDWAPDEIALYTHPPAVRKPLTNGEIYTAYITATNQTLRPQDERLALAFARAIESAHGIGVKP